MITAVSHLAFAADDIEAAAADYEIVLDRKPQRLQAANGKKLIRFPLNNIAFEIFAAEGSGEGLRASPSRRSTSMRRFASSAGAASASVRSQTRHSARMAAAE